MRLNHNNSQIRKLRSKTPNSSAFSRLLPFTPSLLIFLAACAPLSSGQTLFLQNCAACHATSGDAVIVGPSLAGVATRAETRVAGLDAREYIVQSITDPSAYVNPGFKDLMPKSFGNYFSDKELQELVDYLMTLK